jgi:hypothetical protein
MHLIQLFLPLYDNHGAPQALSLFSAVRSELIACFGGLTAYTRAPAHGLWKRDANDVCQDDIVVYEVMASDLDVDWWRGYRQALCQRFQQRDMIVRAQPCELL